VIEYKYGPLILSCDKEARFKGKAKVFGFYIEFSEQEESYHIRLPHIFEARWSVDLDHRPDGLMLHNSIDDIEYFLYEIRFFNAISKQKVLEAFKSLDQFLIMVEYVKYTIILPSL
jgi:hypothetical protein